MFCIITLFVFTNSLSLSLSKTHSLMVQLNKRLNFSVNISTFFRQETRYNSKFAKYGRNCAAYPAHQTVFRPAVSAALPAIRPVSVAPVQSKRRAPVLRRWHWHHSWHRTRLLQSILTINRSRYHSHSFSISLFFVFSSPLSKLF